MSTTHSVSKTSIAALIIVIIVIAASAAYVTQIQPTTITLTSTAERTVTQTITTTVGAGSTVTQTVPQTITQTVTRTATITQTETTTQPPVTTTTPTAPGKPGGTFIIGVEKDEPSLDPLFTQAGVAADTVQNAIYETLVVYDFAMKKIVPRLAESYEQIDDVTYIFKIRKGVSFHDGTPLNANAVKKSFDRILTTQSPRQSQLDMVKEVEVVDDYTVKFILKYPTPNFLPNLTWGTGVVSPTAVEKYGKDYGTAAAVGTGPFKFVEWVKGDHILLERNNAYWGTKPYLDKVLIRIIPEASVRALELERGGIHAAQLSPSDATRLKGSKTVNVQVGPAPRVIMLSINMNASTQETKALLDKRVRQAISYAVDRQALVNSVEEGYAIIGVGIVSPAIGAFWNPSLQVYPPTANIAKAKELLAQAGYPNGFETTLLNFFPWGLPVATVLQAQLDKVGIKLKINNMEFGAGATVMLVDRKYDIALHDWAGTGSPTPYGVMGAFYDPTQVGAWQWNLQNVQDPIMAFLVNEMAIQTDLAAQKGLSDAAQRRAIDEAWGVFLYYPNRIHAVTTAVQGYNLHPHPWYGFVLAMDALNVNVWLQQ
ncbi:MAG: ABC transporter substrate-binding protein [Nitrososphaerales archaeon]